jgi:hypothetical protein
MKSTSDAETPGARKLFTTVIDIAPVAPASVIYGSVQRYGTTYSNSAPSRKSNTVDKPVGCTKLAGASGAAISFPSVRLAAGFEVYGMYVNWTLPPCILDLEKVILNLRSPLQYLKLLPMYNKVDGKKQFLVPVATPG